MQARFILLLSAVVIFSCGGRDNSVVDSGTGGGTATGGGTGTGGGTADAGNGMFLVTTISNAWANLSQFSGGGVEFDNAVVVATTTPFASTGATCVGTKMVETFYVQDATGGPGVAVYRSCKDTAPLPNVGDVVTIQGRLAKFDGSLQVSSYAKTAIPLNITVTAAGTGHSTGGAKSPAGSPITITTAAADYAHSNLLAHPEQLGNVLSFPDAKITAQYPTGFVTTSFDGGTTPNGFEITGGIWVDDSLVYFDCMKGQVPTDGGTFPLPNGIRGIWDRYQDYYGGTAANPAVTLPVLVPTTCADLQ